MSEGAKVEYNVIGHWLYYCSDMYMEHHSISLEFKADGTYFAQTWRTKYHGTYTISGNTITVYASEYFCGAPLNIYTYSGDTHCTYTLNDKKLYDGDNHVFDKTETFANFWN